MKIGVLAVQGDFREHVETLTAIGVEGVEVRRPEQLSDVSGLILPGGESTAIRRLIERWGLREPILDLARRIKDRTGSASEIQLIPHDRIYDGRFEDMVRGAPDIDKIGGLTGWAPTENLGSILEETIADARMNSA